MGKTSMNVKTQLAVGAACLLMVGHVTASPSGLNNIPTADVAPERTLVFQSWGTFASGAGPDWTAGAKYGLIEGVEIGIDQRVGSDDTGPLTFQAKYQIPGLGDALPVQPLVGVANVSDDRDEAGEADPYIVLTFDVEIIRFHAGYSFQDENEAVFGGLDKTFELMDRDLMLRADVRQISDGDETLSSIGFLYVLPYNFVFEGWGSFPSTSGAEDSLTAKLNYVVSF